MCFSLDFGTTDSFLKRWIEYAPLLSVVSVVFLCCFKKKKSSEVERADGTQDNLTRSEDTQRRRHKHTKIGSSPEMEKQKVEEESWDSLCSRCREKAENFSSIRRTLEKYKQQDTARNSDGRRLRHKHRKKRNEREQSADTDQNETEEGAEQDDETSEEQGGVPAKFSASLAPDGSTFILIDENGNVIGNRKLGLPQQAFGSDMDERIPMKDQIGRIAAEIQRLRQEQADNRSRTYDQKTAESRTYT